MSADEPVELRLLRALNEWHALRDDQLADTGEVGSRIDALLQELERHGVTVELHDGRYRIVPAQPTGGRAP